MKILWFDTETTGLDPVKNDIIQIAGIIEIDGNVKEEFQFWAKPPKDADIQDEALKVHGYSKIDIKQWPDPKFMYAGLIGIFGKYVDKFKKYDKFIPAGHNVKFDIEFLSQLFKKQKDDYFGSWMIWQPFCTMHAAVINTILGNIKPDNYKLITLAEHYKIPLKAHDAMEDIRATREIGLKFLQDFKNINW